METITNPQTNRDVEGKTESSCVPAVKRIKRTLRVLTLHKHWIGLAVSVCKGLGSVN